ncbi:MAG TPA: histidine phosphatase family protein [Acidimicrobiales bacterium]|nr:histidine phosphatase family protein [Acidimicrobiales bacterium]
MDDVTRLVLVRHGEATCNVAGVVGGPKGCTGLTALGRVQAARLAERLARTRELGHVDGLYASVLSRAVETAEILAPGLASPGRTAPPLTTDCALCELHPGAADALSWDEYLARFAEPDWDVDPGAPIAPGGEGWTGFVERAGTALEQLAARHPGETLVVVTHAGVVEASLLRFLPLAAGVTRLKLRTLHASLTVWQRTGGTAEPSWKDGPGGQRSWLLERYNDAAVL